MVKSSEQLKKTIHPSVIEFLDVVATIWAAKIIAETMEKRIVNAG